MTVFLITVPIVHAYIIPPFQLCCDQSRSRAAAIIKDEVSGIGVGSNCITAKFYRLLGWMYCYRWVRLRKPPNRTGVLVPVFTGLNRNIIPIVSARTNIFAVLPNGFPLAMIGGSMRHLRVICRWGSIEDHNVFMLAQRHLFRIQKTTFEDFIPHNVIAMHFRI